MSRIITSIFLFTILFITTACDFSGLGIARDGKHVGTGAVNHFNPNEKLKVALVVPLSGRNSNLGKSLLDAANLAIHDSKFENIDLIPIDSNSNNMANALRTNNIQIVMGPLFSSKTQQLNDYAMNLNIPVLTFSNDIALAGNKGIFIMGILPSQQIEVIVGYAKSHGYDNIITVTPYGRYGDIVENITRVTNVNYVKNFEYSTSGGRVNNFNQIVMDIKQLISNNKNYGILFPEGGANLQDFVRTFNLSIDEGARVKILGSSQWEGSNAMLSQALNGSWYPSIDNRKMNAFMTKFNNAFGYSPNTIAVLGYDAVKVVQQFYNHLSRTGAVSIDYDYLYRTSFDIVTGPLEFEKDGKNSRKLVVMEVNDGNKKIIN